MPNPLKFLFKFPCRGRVKELFASLDSLHVNIRDRENYHISLTLDEDDEILNNCEVVDRINMYSNVSIEWGKSISKIDAINRSMPKIDYDILIVWSNDMFATMYGFDDIMRSYMVDIMQEHGDELLFHFPEPDSREFLNVLFISTKKYYDRFSYIYHPSYVSLFCDNETMEVARLLKKYHYVNIMGLYEHRNPAYGKYNIQRDSLFNLQQSYWNIDEQNFNERKKRNFDLAL